MGLLTYEVLDLHIWKITQNWPYKISAQIISSSKKWWYDECL